MADSLTITSTYAGESALPYINAAAPLELAKMDSKNRIFSIINKYK